MDDKDWLKKSLGEEETAENVEDLLASINGMLGLGSDEQLELKEPGEYESPSALGSFSTDKLKEQGFWDSQIAEIQKGIEQQLDVQRYACTSYNWMQMYEIRIGLFEGLNVDMYCSSLYSCEQMREIRLGLEDDLNVQVYAKIQVSATEMQAKRREMLHQIYMKKERKGFEKTIHDDNSGVDIKLSDNLMEASLLIRGITKKYTQKEVMEILKKNEITFGINEDAIRMMVDMNIRNKFVIVATGLEPGVGSDGKYETFFRGELPESPKVNPDGTVNYSNVVVAEKVMPGQVLAVYTPAKPGGNGNTVNGIVIDGTRGKDLPDLTGSNIRFDKNVHSYFATQKGYASFNRYAFTLNVWQMYTIHGDANCYNGNVIYDGNVYVEGSVLDMTVIKASGDVIVDGFVAAATIQAGQNVVIRGGANMNGKGLIQAGGKIMGNFFENSTLSAVGSIEANYFLNCVMETDDKVLARGSKSRIMGGSINAALAIEAGFIGNPGAGKTQFTVGDLYTLGVRLTKTQMLYDKSSDELDKLNQGKDKILETLGEEKAASNPVYVKTLSAIEIKEREVDSIKKELDHISDVKYNAEKAYVKVTGELQPNVVLTINGAKKEVLGSVYDVTLTREKSKDPFKHKE